MRTAKIVDVGPSNRAAVEQLLIQSGYKVLNRETNNVLSDVDLLVLPGVGHFKNAMENLSKNDSGDQIKDLARQGMPVLGICLGMQLLGTLSQEAPGVKGLGIIDMESKLVYPQAQLGWRYLTDFCPGFYFHNHAFAVGRATDTDLQVHDSNKFVSLCSKGKTVGVQFHPEKSQKQGLELMKRIKLEIWDHP
jgi:glutamine amidotransferase